MNKKLEFIQNIIGRNNMKKIIFMLLFLIILTGCSDISNTPTRQVEGLFNKYQTLDREILEDLDNVINERDFFSDKSRVEYRDIIKKQYKNLTYKIKDETVDGDTALVTVEIEVIDFSKVLVEADDYKNNNPEQFIDSNGEYQKTLYYDYVISKMKEAKEKVKYTLDIKLSKIIEDWHIDGIDSETEDKILGIYKY